MWAWTGGTSQLASLALSGDKARLFRIMEDKKEGPMVSTNKPRMITKQPSIPVARKQFLVWMD